MKKRIVANPFNMILSGAFLLGMAVYCAFMGGGFLSLIGCILLWCVIEGAMNVKRVDEDFDLYEETTRRKKKNLLWLAFREPVAMKFRIPSDFYEVYFSIKEERRVIFFSWVVVLIGCFAMMTGVEDSLGYKGPINTEKYIPVFALVPAGCLLDLIMTFVRRRASRNGAGSGE